MLPRTHKDKSDKKDNTFADHHCHEMTWNPAIRQAEYAGQGLGYFASLNTPRLFSEFQTHAEINEKPGENQC